MAFLDDLVTSTQKLEAALNEAADGYYRDSARLLMKGREIKNPKSQPLLFVRNNIKIGFFHEFRQEWGACLSHYTLAHGMMLDCIQPFNAWEVKAIADLINFKICKIHLLVGAVSKAITHFHNHMRMWRGNVWSDITDFRHCGWLAKQYQVR